jgi:glycolate oxidase FAD binding subunit
MDSALKQVSDRIAAARADRQPLHLRGGGTKDFYGAAPQGELLDTRVLNGVRSYEPSELVVTVRAGTPLAELEALLLEKGQCLPFEPPHYAWSAATATGSGATVGGTVASGWSGPARASVGGVRDYVLGVQMINGLGEHLTFGGQVMKNVAGYDVSRLMAGAMGTLGLITEVSLKVLPLAPAEATLCFELPQHAALEQLHVWGGQPLPLNASCWVRDTTTGAAHDVLFVRLRGAAAAVDAACRSMLMDQRGQRMDTAQAAADWTLCRNHQLSFFTHPPQPGLVLWRLSLPQTAPVLDLPWATLVEWHGALRWVWAPVDAGPQLQTAATQQGGSATLFVAAGAHSAWATGQFDLKNPAQRAIHQRLKASFDPEALFNPGRWAAAS